MKALAYTGQVDAPVDAQWGDLQVAAIDQSGASRWRSPAGLQQAALATCSGCHMGPGLYSVNSFAGLTRFDAAANVVSTFGLEAIRSVAWKSVQPDWLALSQLWNEAR